MSLIALTATTGPMKRVLVIMAGVTMNCNIIVKKIQAFLMDTLSLKRMKKVLGEEITPLLEWLLKTNLTSNTDV
ncbi:UNVERIFIED_CONTAM: hypothetical protein GTU68_012119 [Idotea baltica]|nr:hypothetical protein [Idotea baltica]